MPWCCRRSERVRPAPEETAAGLDCVDADKEKAVGKTPTDADADEENAVGKTLSDEEMLRAWLLPKTPWYFIHGGKRLHVRHWLPQGPIRASIIYAHGLNCHVNDPKTADYCEAMADLGYAVLAFDLVGNGYSEGLRAYVKDFRDVFASLVRFAELAVGGAEDEQCCLGLDGSVQEQLRAVPFFLLGVSMGGLIAFSAALQLQDSPLAGRFGGLVLVAPALAVDLPPWAVVRLMQVLVAPLAGKRLMPQALAGASIPKAEFIGRDAEYFAMLRRDSWEQFPDTGLSWRGRMRWATASAFATVFSTVHKDMSQLRCPFLVIHDPEDRITSFRGSQSLMLRSASKDKTLLTAHDALHGVMLTEPEWSRGKMVEWMGERCP